MLYLITTGEATDSSLVETSQNVLNIIKAAVQNQISLLQLREKNLSARSLFDLTVAASAITRGSQTRLLVNDRADIALAANADGVHLASNSMTARVIRSTFPKDFIIGVSTHSLYAATNAAADDADFAVFGPVFDTPGKGEPQGLAALGEICEKLRPFPMIGLGGVDESNCESVLGTGAVGIAAVRALNDPQSLISIIRKLRK